MEENLEIDSGPGTIGATVRLPPGAGAGSSRRREEIEMPPDEMFRHIRGPALFPSGALDRNVPPRHAFRAAEIMSGSGNPDVEAACVPGADHSFQEAAGDEHDRMRERHTFESFRRPYRGEVYRRILGRLQRVVPPVDPVVDWEDVQREMVAPCEPVLHLGD